MLHGAEGGRAALTKAARSSNLADWSKARNASTTDIQLLLLYSRQIRPCLGRLAGRTLHATEDLIARSCYTLYPMPILAGQALLRIAQAMTDEHELGNINHQQILSMRTGPQACIDHLRYQLDPQ